MNSLLVTTLGFDLTLIDRLAKSIDFPIRDKVVVSNENHATVAQWCNSHPDWTHHANEYGGPCLASAWNLAPKLFDNEISALMFNDDVYFPPGAVETICHVADHNIGYPFLTMDDDEDFHAFVWNRCGWETLGTFDENFFPAYFEDTDMKVRVKLAGGKIEHVFDAVTPVFHKKPPIGNRCTEMIHGCYLFNREYYYRKWGCLENHLEPVYKTPFNKGGSLNSWELDLGRRVSMLKIWETFMAFPNPSTYT